MKFDIPDKQVRIRVCGIRETSEPAETPTGAIVNSPDKFLIQFCVIQGVTLDITTP